MAIYTSCNNGSSSIITKDGELYMFGKDAIYCDSTCKRNIKQLLLTVCLNLIGVLYLRQCKTMSQNALISFLGQVSDLKGHFVTQVAMGKAHTCVLTKSGEVWTFGVNNKGQCGRDTGSMTQAGKGKT